MSLREEDMKLISSLPRRVFMVSDLIAYTVNIPATIITMFIVLDVSGRNILLFSIITAAIVTAACFLTVFQLKKFFAPVLEYFKKLSLGEPVSDEEYFEAKKRFYSTPPCQGDQRRSCLGGTFAGGNCPFYAGIQPVVYRGA